MKKTPLLLALLSVFTFHLSPFTSLHAQTSKEINKIKRSSSYLYAEATMDTEQEAADIAYELLMKQVEEYIASKRKLSEADNVLIKDIKSRSEQLNMMRGEMHRVFVYVEKNAIEGVENTTVVNNASGATVAINSPVQPTPKPTPKPTPHPSTSTLPPPPSDLQPPTSTLQPPTSDLQPPTSDLQPPTSDLRPQHSPLPAWQQQAVADLLDCADLAAVRAKLNRLKAQYKVKRFGTADHCPNAAEACWAIFDNQGILLTILGPGTNTRLDYRSMRESSLEAYKGMNALWFNFAK